MQTILLTGFEPFNGESVNPAWEAVHALEAWRGADFRIAVRQLPCTFGLACEAINAAVTQCSPAIVIAVGQAGGRAEMSVERVAINIDDARIADNRQHQPIDVPVVAGAPAAYFSTLPIKAIVQGMREAGIPAAVSQSAGTFVCNHVFYGLMHHLATRQSMPVVRAGFIHVPFLPQQAAAHPGAPSMALADIITGLRIAVAVTLATQGDLRVSEGQLD
ncbi:MAG: pyroglutamyl-peptidase I [Herminiimonas sp.]|nr:pyroglutamyl-peptidase I [Herminiimonas sp.]